MGEGPRLLLSSQTLAPGNGGICTLARMTAAALSRRYDVRALACEDVPTAMIGSVPVRGFGGNRAMFAVGNFLECRRASHVLYDFAGTARAHFDLPGMRTPYAVWVHGVEVWEDAPAKYRRTLAGAALLLVNSEYTRARAGRAIPAGVPVKVCPLGTPQNESACATRDESAPPTVMLLGRVDHMLAKGRNLLIDVWPKVISAVPDARLLFVGGGEALERLRAMVAASPARGAIEIADFVSEPELENYWRRATVFAMPGASEGFGLVYADAMRHGIPVIASRDDAGQEVNVHGETGFNIARADREGLADALVRLLRDRDLARKLGAGGLARWKAHYTFDAFAGRLLAATEDFFALP